MRDAISTNPAADCSDNCAQTWAQCLPKLEAMPCEWTPGDGGRQHHRTRGEATVPAAVLQDGDEICSSDPLEARGRTEKSQICSATVMKAQTWTSAIKRSKNHLARSATGPRSGAQRGPGAQWLNEVEKLMPSRRVNSSARGEQLPGHAQEKGSACKRTASTTSPAELCDPSTR